MRWPFAKSHLPSHFRDSLKDLWIECCWPKWYQPDLSSLTSLRSLHLDWWFFSIDVPPSLRRISITMPKERFPTANYDEFEASLEHLSQCLPSLELIRIRAAMVTFPSTMKMKYAGSFDFEELSS